VTSTDDCGLFGPDSVSWRVQADPAAGIGGVDAAAAHVRGLHSFVRGTDPVTGQSYSARNPELITWVHVTEVHGFLTAVQRGGLGLSAEEIDAYYREQV